jgi:hypothetical protein
LAIHPTQRKLFTQAILESVIDSRGGINAGEYRAHGSTRSVNSKRIQCVVVTKLALHRRMIAICRFRLVFPPVSQVSAKCDAGAGGDITAW